MDYDKNPIIIKDYNMIFGFYVKVIFMVIILSVFIFKEDISSHSIYWFLGVFFPIYLLPKLKSQYTSFGKRKIRLTNNEISFNHNNETLEKIQLNHITAIYKTQHDLFHKSQIEKDTNIINIILGPLMCLFRHFLTIIIKLFFHIIMNRLKGYKFYDAIIIFDNKRFINILASNVDEYKNLENYFKIKKNINIREQSIYTKIIYDFENINNEKINE